jgi:putative ABC transport system permease protein
VLLLVRTAPGIDANAMIRRVLTENHPNLTPFDVTTLQEEIAQSAAVFRLSMGIYGGIGVFGLLLAVVGLAGVTSYAVARRTQEIGIRRALGAQNRDILLLVLKEALVLIGLGTTLGLIVAFAAARTMAATLSAMAEITQTSLYDPVLILGAPLLLAGFALLACYLPARRSLRIEPIQALRTQ